MAKVLSSFIPSNKVDIFGSDSLMTRTFPYYLLLLVEVAGLWTHHVTQNPFIILFIIYSFVPLLDEFFSLDGRNPSKEESK